MAERAVTQFAMLAASKLLAMLLSVGTTLVVGWLLGPAGLGRWTLLAAAGALLHTALINWTHPATVRFGREEWLRTHSLSRTLRVRLPLLAIGLVLAAVLVTFDPANWQQRWFGASGSDAVLIVLFALSAWMASEAQATCQATDRIHWQAALAPAIGAASMIALLALLWSGRTTVIGAVLAVTVAPIVGWGSAWVAALARSGHGPAAPPSTDLRRSLRYALPLLPMFVVGYASDWGDHLLLRYFASLTDVGLFGMAYQVFLTLLAANGVLTTLMLPRVIAQEVAAPGSVRTYVDTEVPTLYVLWMIGTVWLVAIIPGVVRLFSAASFDASLASLLILLIAVPSSVVTSLYTVPFNVQERTWRMFFYALAMTGTNLAVSIALIPRYGAAGAAIGTTVSYGVSHVLYVRDQHALLALPARPVWILWATGVALGVAQFAVGAATVVRLEWAVAATAVLILIARAAHCVDERLVDRLFPGKLSRIAEFINRALVAKA